MALETHLDLIVLSLPLAVSLLCLSLSVATEDLHLPLEAADPFIDGVKDGAEDEEEEAEEEEAWSRRRWRAGAEESEASEKHAPPTCESQILYSIVDWQWQLVSGG